MSQPSKNLPPKNAPLAPPTTPSFTVKESALIGRLGLSRDTLRELRAAHLREGLDWAQIGRRILLTEEAAFTIATAARLRPSDLPPAPPEGITDPRRLLTFPGCPDGLTCVLKAWRWWPQLNNRTIMEAYRRGTDPHDRRNIVRVRVQDSANFVPHMEIPARLLQSPDLYECTRPAPRSKGRW